MKPFVSPLRGMALPVLAACWFFIAPVWAAAAGTDWLPLDREAVIGTLEKITANHYPDADLV